MATGCCSRYFLIHWFDPSLSMASEILETPGTWKVRFSGYTQYISILSRTFSGRLWRLYCASGFTLSSMEWDTLRNMWMDMGALKGGIKLAKTRGFIGLVWAMSNWNYWNDCQRRNNRNLGQLGLLNVWHSALCHEESQWAYVSIALCLSCIWHSMTQWLSMCTCSISILIHYIHIIYSNCM